MSCYEEPEERFGGGPRLMDKLDIVAVWIITLSIIAFGTIIVLVAMASENFFVVLGSFVWGGGFLWAVWRLGRQPD